MQIKVKLVYQIFVTKPRRIQWRTEEAYLKSEAVAALPKLRWGLGGADFEDCFLKDAGHDRVYCFRLAPKVSLPSGSENDRDGLMQPNIVQKTKYKILDSLLQEVSMCWILFIIICRFKSWF